MRDFAFITDKIDDAKETLGLPKRHDITNNKSIKLEVARSLSAGMHPKEIEALGYEIPKVRRDDSSWVAIWAYLVIGKRFPTWFTKELDAGNVELVGRSAKSMPSEFGQLKLPVVAKASDKDKIYVVGDDKYVDTAEYKTVTTHQLALDLVKEVAPGKDQVYAFLRLLGFETPEDGKPGHGEIYSLNRGWDDALVFCNDKDGTSLDSKKLKGYLAFAGKVVGDPIKGEAPWEGIFWVLQYALAGTGDAKISARRRFLTEAWGDDSEGASVMGLSLIAREAQCGMLGVYASAAGGINVCNAWSVPVWAHTTTDSLKETIDAANAAEIVWAMHHQGAWMRLKAGAQASGMAFCKNHITGQWELVTPQGIDKAQKFFQRTVTLMVKASCNSKVVVTPQMSNTLSMVDYEKALNLKPNTTALPKDTLAELPIADFHELKVKDMKALICANYAPTRTPVCVVTGMAIAVRDYYKMNVGMSYRAHVTCLIMLKIAEAQAVDAELIEMLQRCVAWSGRILHEGGSLGGYTPKWAKFWENFNSCTRLFMSMTYDAAVNAAEDDLVKAGTLADCDRTWGFEWFKSRKDAEEKAGINPIYSGVEALMKTAEVLLPEDERQLDESEWGIVLKARMTTIIMGQLEAQKDVALEIEDKKVLNSDINFLNIDLGELALLVGTVSRGSKGILAQSWNVEAVAESGSRGNFAERLTDATINRAFPVDCLTKQAVDQLGRLHRRLANYKRAAEAARESDAWESVTGA